MAKKTKKVVKKTVKKKVPVKKGAPVKKKVAKVKKKVAPSEGIKKKVKKVKKKVVAEGKKAVPVKKKVAKVRRSSSKVIRLKAYWGVFNQSLRRVALFEFNERKKADDKATELSNNAKGTPHFVMPVKEAIEG
jgi:hypothetical protein